MRRRRWNLQLGRAGEHLGETDADTFDDGEQNGTTNGTVSRRLVASSNRKGTTGEETSDDGIPRILLLSHALDGAIESREETTPDTEVAAEDRRSHLHGGNGTDSSLAIGRISKSLDTVPDGATDGLQR